MIFESLVSFVSSQATLVVVVFLILIYALMKIINSDNPLEWWHFISSKGADGQQYADIDKLGKSVGIVVSSIVILLMAHHQKIDAVLLGVYLAFVGGIAGYSAYLRSKNGHSITIEEKKDEGK